MLKNLIAFFCVLALPLYAADRPDGPADRAQKAGETADKQQPTPATKTAATGEVKEWITKAAEAGLAEVELGKLAAKQAQNAEVKEFGQRMVNDHSKANEELMKIAKAKGVTPPAQPAKKHREMQLELAKAKGADFDKKYMTGQVEDHKEALELFEKGAKSNDPEIQQFASSKLPILQAHLQMAEKVKPPRVPK
jgi:putative membrane protein